MCQNAKPERLERGDSCLLLKLRWMETQRVQMKGVLPWLVRWACRARKKFHFLCGAEPGIELVEKASSKLQSEKILRFTLRTVFVILWKKVFFSLNSVCLVIAHSEDQNRREQNGILQKSNPSVFLCPWIVWYEFFLSLNGPERNSEGFFFFEMGRNGILSILSSADWFKTKL